MPTTHGTETPTAVLVEDLFFQGMISSAAARAGLPIKFVRSNNALPSGARNAILDLLWPGEWEDVIAEFVAAGGEVIAFGPHTDGPLLKRGRAAGCSRVMARSKFVEELPKILARFAGKADPVNAHCGST